MTAGQQTTNDHDRISIAASGTHDSLTPNGKPRRALRTLAISTPENPLTEYDVYRLNQRVGSWKAKSWHAALATLVKRGLAARCGGQRPAQWYITEEGARALEES